MCNLKPVKDRSKKSGQTRRNKTVGNAPAFILGIGATAFILLGTGAMPACPNERMQVHGENYSKPKYPTAGISPSTPRLLWWNTLPGWSWLAVSKKNPSWSSATTQYGWVSLDRCEVLVFRVYNYGRSHSQPSGNRNNNIQIPTK